MTVQILRSIADSISDNFPQAVNQYIQALEHHRFVPPARMAVPAVPGTPMVPAKQGRPARMGQRAVAPIAAVAGTPPPTAHPVIESCVKRVPQPDSFDLFVADYVIVDG